MKKIVSMESESTNYLNQIKSYYTNLNTLTTVGNTYLYPAHFDGFQVL